LPTENDNVAIACCRLEQGTSISVSGETTVVTLDHTILEGHRFAVEPIRKGDPLLSWGLPFGCALRDIGALGPLDTPPGQASWFQRKEEHGDSIAPPLIQHCPTIHVQPRVLMLSTRMCSRLC